MHGDTLLCQFGALGWIGRVSVVADECSFKGGFQQGVESIDIVPVAGKLDQIHQHSPRRENQMFPDAVEVHFQRRAIAGSRQAVEALELACANDTADVDRMGVDRKKGGCASPAIEQNAPLSCSINPDSNARRSANFWRWMSRGKSC